MNSVSEWLETIGLGEYKDDFIREGFDNILVIPHITEHDLAIIGVKPGHRKKILIHATQLLKAKKPVPSLSLNKSPNSAASTPRKRLSSPGPGLVSTPKGSPSPYQTPRTPTSPSPTKQRVNKTIYDKLTDTSLYTGSHKLRFDSSGKGVGIKELEKKKYTPRKAVSAPTTPRESPTKPLYSSSLARPQTSDILVLYHISKKNSCKYAPLLQCSTTEHYNTCLHCNRGYCSSCLWGDGGKMKYFDKCSYCGKNPRNLPNSLRGDWKF